jgi:ABC-type transport system involved in multi-copper enzyme maturation permease subunit
MYLWKCWRDNRFRFIVFLILMVAFAWLVHMQVLLQNKIMRFTLSVDPELAREYWRDLSEQIGTGFFFPCLFTMALGSSGVGDEYARGTAEFLLTRPRSRRYFIWVSWFTGALEVLTIVLTFVLLAFLAAIYVTRILYTWRFLVMVVPIFLFAMVAYGVIGLMTALQRSGRKGYATGLGLLVLYVLVYDVLQLRWGFHVPRPTDLMHRFSELATDASGVHSSSGFPVVAIVGWSLFALACPLLSQMYIDRTDV